MTEVEELKSQLIAVYSTAQAVDATDNWQDRKHALEDMHRAVKEARLLMLQYAADLMVDSDEHPLAWPSPPLEGGK